MERRVSLTCEVLAKDKILGVHKLLGGGGLGDSQFRSIKTWELGGGRRGGAERSVPCPTGGNIL